MRAGDHLRGGGWELLDALTQRLRQHCLLFGGRWILNFRQEVLVVEFHAVAFPLPRAKFPANLIACDLCDPCSEIALPLESIQAAMTVVRSRAAILGLEEGFHVKSEVHNHVPEGATP